MEEPTRSSRFRSFVHDFGAVAALCVAIGTAAIVVYQYKVKVDQFDEVSDQAKTLADKVETSHAEIQSLQAQLLELQDRVKVSTTSNGRGPKGDKGDPGEVGPQGQKGERGRPGQDADFQRIEALEAQLRDLEKNISKVADQPLSSFTSSEVNNTANAMERILEHGFHGVATSPKITWPYKVTNVNFSDENHFSGDLEWMSAASIHKINGTFFNGAVYFKETSYIKRGGAILGCEYITRIATSGQSGGTYKCRGVEEGTFSLLLD